MTTLQSTKAKLPKGKKTSLRRTGEDSVTQGVEQYKQILDSADPKAIAIYLSLWKANHAQALANSRAIDSLNLPVSVSGTRLTVLRTLFFAPDKQMALNEISKNTGFSPALITHLIEGLAQAGLVRRLGSPDDRRVKLAQITAEGEEAFHAVLPVISARMTAACVDFTEDEKDQFLLLLQRLF